jgi:hypothetical protein
VYARHVGDQHLIPADLVQRIQTIRTHLNRFSPGECEALMYHAYLMTDAFLWAHRDNCPNPYRVSSPPAPEWLIRFTDDIRSEWNRALPERTI